MAQLNGALRVVIFSGTGLLLMLVLIQAWAGTNGSAIFNLLLVAVAGFGVGGFAGFIFGAVGEEKQSFGGMATVINGIIGGFALSDLTQDNGVIRAVLRSLDAACGQPGVGLVACVLVFFGATGFVFMYVNKQYLLNPELSAKQTLADQHQRLLALTRNVTVSLAEVGSRPATDPTLLESIRTALQDFEASVQNEPELVGLLPMESLQAYSKAYYLAGDLPKAESMLRRARGLAPDDPDILFYLAHILVESHRPTEAIPYLKFLQALPNPPVLTWKLLGYACLFDSNRLAEAETATRQYLGLAPNDAGAHLNLACVYGQRGPSEANNVTQAMASLRTALQLDPALRSFVKETLTQPGQDFAAWTAIPEFSNL
jgi:tetratricopeptide (TPR) repeat protein